MHPKWAVTGQRGEKEMNLKTEQGMTCGNNFDRYTDVKQPRAMIITLELMALHQKQKVYHVMAQAGWPLSFEKKLALSSILEVAKYAFHDHPEQIAILLADNKITKLKK